MDLAKSLGMERKQGKPELVSYYDLWCPKCGYRSATWSIDGPNARHYVRETFNRMYSEVTVPAHAEHGTFTILEEKTYSYV
jgi:hypothetical protein